MVFERYSILIMETQRDRNRAKKDKLKLTSRQISEATGVPHSTVLRYFGTRPCGFEVDTERPITDYLADLEDEPTTDYFGVMITEKSNEIDYLKIKIAELEDQIRDYKRITIKQRRTITLVTAGMTLLVGITLVMVLIMEARI